MPAEVVFLLAFLFGGTFWVTRPLIHALADRLRHRGEPAEGRLGEEVLEELRSMRREMAELAERVEFTERLLAQGRNEPGLVPPRNG